MENVNVIEAILDKKMDSYSFEQKNFKASGELTVTITLSEYRDLVGKAATRDDAIAKAESDKYTRQNEIENLKKEISSLKAENYELKKALDDISDESEDK